MFNTRLILNLVPFKFVFLISLVPNNNYLSTQKLQIWAFLSLKGNMAWESWFSVDVLAADGHFFGIQVSEDGIYWFELRVRTNYLLKPEQLKWFLTYLVTRVFNVYSQSEIVCFHLWLVHTLQRLYFVCVANTVFHKIKNSFF